MGKLKTVQAVELDPTIISILEVEELSRVLRALLYVRGCTTLANLFALLIDFDGDFTNIQIDGFQPFDKQASMMMERLLKDHPATKAEYAENVQWEEIEDDPSTPQNENDLVSKPIGQWIRQGWTSVMEFEVKLPQRVGKK
jgi:hypothetical protein